MPQNKRRYQFDCRKRLDCRKRPEFAPRSRRRAFRANALRCRFVVWRCDKRPHLSAGIRAAAKSCVVQNGVFAFGIRPILFDYEFNDRKSAGDLSFPARALADEVWTLSCDGSTQNFLTVKSVCDLKPRMRKQKRRKKTKCQIVPEAKRAKTKFVFTLCLLRFLANPVGLEPTTHWSKAGFLALSVRIGCCI